MSGDAAAAAAPPLVSVVIVTHGGWGQVRTALDALARNTTLPYETIVVDNDSPDGTAERLEEVEGIRLLRQPANLGFAGGCDVGALHARASLLCFLNPDAYVEPGWLEPLVETIESRPSTGAAVPLLLNPDGSIQEAGSFACRDGVTFALDEQVFERRELTFLREVDMASAACLLLPRAVFSSVGGFDPAYDRAYYEDADLCFTLRRRGYRVLLDPRSRVVHERLRSQAAAAELMHENRLVFAERWRTELRGRTPSTDVLERRSALLDARSHAAPDRVLVVDDRVPPHDKGAGFPRMRQLLDALARMLPPGAVTLLARDGVDADRYSPALEAEGIEIAAGVADVGAWFRERALHYSVAVVSRPHNHELYDGLLRETQPGAARVYDAEALFYRRLERQVELTPPAGRDAAAAEAAAVRTLELDAIREADAVLCVSLEEARLARAVAGRDRVALLPAHLDLREPLLPAGERDGLVFYGGFLAGPGSPNEDALLHLVQEVLPRLRAAGVEGRLDVVGADPTPAVAALEGPDVRVRGYVEDPLAELERYRLLVSPVRAGSGIKLKLLDAIAAGLPFVTTSVGAEGIVPARLRPLVVADDPSELASLAVSLLADEERWEHVQTALAAHARRRFDEERFRTTLARTLARLGVGVRLE